MNLRPSSISRGSRGPRHTRRAFATFIVLWTIALAAMIVVALQSISHRTAAAGRTTLARTRAHWAARAGIEAQIAALTADTLAPDTTSAYTVHADLAEAAIGNLRSASYRVQYTDAIGVVRDGSLDAHSKLNVNALSPDSIILIPDMDTALADAIIDWIDEDDDPEEQGAEEGQYVSVRSGYAPRNAPMRSLREIELIVGVDPEYLRGEDWNLNGLLDPNENDGNLSWPPDNADGKLDEGWSKYLTAVSDDSLPPGYGLSGQPRLDLLDTTAQDLAARIRVDNSQAEAILEHIAGGGSLADFIETDLGELTGTAGTLLNGQQNNPVASLSREQLGSLLAETYLAEDSFGPRTGKLNINTVDEDALQYLAELPSATADSIITERNARSGGFVYLTDLLDVPAVTNQVLAELYPLLDVRSNVFVAVSRGRDAASGLEVEIQATLDRSTIPVIIKDLIVR